MIANDELLRALRNGDTQAAGRALTAGADANIAVDGFPAMCTAAGQGCEAAIRLLAEYGADPNVPDQDGRTPIMWVAAFCREHNTAAMLDALASMGADFERKSHDGRTVMDHATATGNTRAMRWLLQNGAEGSRASTIRARRTGRASEQEGGR